MPLWGSHDIVDAQTGELICRTIDINEGRYWGDCPMCGKEKRLDHAVAWCCGPTHDQIGSMSTEYRDTEVGGRCVCKECHDKFYGDNA